MNNYKFETLQLHVGQEQARFTKPHLMFFTIPSTPPTVSA